MRISVKKYHTDYLKDLLKIFNSGRESGFFFRTKKITLKEHKTWVEKNLNEKNIEIYLAFVENFLKPVGYVRFDKLSEEKKIYEVSIAVMSSFYSKGIGTHMLAKSIKRFKKAKKLVAIVKKDNPRSWKVFLKNFFIIKKTNTNKNILSKNFFNYRLEYYLIRNKI